MRALAIACVLLAACDPPPLTLRYRLTSGPTQQCIGPTGNETTDCADMTMECDAVLSIRIVPPNEPDVPYVFLCEPMPRIMPRTLCSIAGVDDLPQPKKPIPEQVLEVQMAVFPRSVVPEVDGKLQCPIVEFGVDNFPVTLADCTSAENATVCDRRPAVGGRAFYHPGDEETIVELGCSEFELLRGEMCNGMNQTDVFATVTGFEDPGIDLATANRLFVSIGEPVPGTMNNYTLDSSQIHPLPRDPTAFPPTWADTFDNLNLSSSYCIEVLEDAPMATRTLTCRSTPANPSRVDATGTWLKPSTLSTILKADNLTTFPSQGLVVGIVLSAQFAPVANATVTAPCATLMDNDPNKCTIKYLSADKMSFNTTSTSSNGIWISEDARYTTVFSRKDVVTSTTAFGGLVDNKVTIVVLQETGVGM